MLGVLPPDQLYDEPPLAVSDTEPQPDAVPVILGETAPLVSVPLVAGLIEKQLPPPVIVL